MLVHIEHARRVMHEQLRVLASGDRLWFSTPACETKLRPLFIHPYAISAFGHVRNGYTADQLQQLLPDNQCRFELFYWDDPAFRAAFVPLHILDRLAPLLVDIGTRWCFAVDNMFA